LDTTTRTHGRSARAQSVAVAVLFALVAMLAAMDLAVDLRHGTTFAHAALEGTMVAAALVGVFWVVSRARTLAHHARALASDLDASRAEAARWRAEASDLISGLGAAIDRQLERWGLTAAEKEIALLLLKGLSHKEIAVVREVNETTVRQQARAIYRKSGLGGRHDLAAFFLEDLLGPR
jgi:DNA-binding CsgD family transcriptional regulator